MAELPGPGPAPRARTPFCRWLRSFLLCWPRLHTNLNIPTRHPIPLPPPFSIVGIRFSAYSRFLLLLSFTGIMLPSPQNIMKSYLYLHSYFPMSYNYAKNIFAIHISDNGLKFRIYKEALKCKKGTTHSLSSSHFPLKGILSFSTYRFFCFPAKQK